jgi:hypothetical protein
MAPPPGKQVLGRWRPNDGNRKNVLDPRGGLRHYVSANSQPTVVSSVYTMSYRVRSYRCTWMGQGRKSHCCAHVVDQSLNSSDTAADQSGWLDDGSLGRTLVCWVRQKGISSLMPYRSDAGSASIMRGPWPADASLSSTDAIWSIASANRSKLCVLAWVSHMQQAAVDAMEHVFGARSDT